MNKNLDYQIHAPDLPSENPNIVAIVYLKDDNQVSIVTKYGCISSELILLDLLPSALQLDVLHFRSHG